jgi:hypothetical protein
LLYSVCNKQKVWINPGHRFLLWFINFTRWVLSFFWPHQSMDSDNRLRIIVASFSLALVSTCSHDFIFL